MKTKNINNNLEPATKQDIQDLALSTKQSIQKLDKDIESLSNSMIERFELGENILEGVKNKVDSLEVKFDSLEVKVDNLEVKVDKLTDAIATMQDKIVGKLENLETENTVGTEQYRRVHVTLETHEKRLKTLERAKN